MLLHLHYTREGKLGSLGTQTGLLALLTSCCVGQEALGFIEYIRQIVAILGVARDIVIRLRYFAYRYSIEISSFNLHFRAFGAKQILKIAINAKERKRWQPLAQITCKFYLFRFIEATLI